MHSTVHQPEALLFNVLLQLIVMIAAARLGNHLSRRVGRPGVMGETIAGLVLGPTLFGHSFPGLSLALFGEYGLTQTEVGVVAISAAAISDVTGWVLLAAICAYAHFSAGAVGLQVTGILTPAAAAWFLLRPLARLVHVMPVGVEASGVCCCPIGHFIFMTRNT